MPDCSGALDVTGGPRLLPLGRAPWTPGPRALRPQLSVAALPYRPESPHTTFVSHAPHPLTPSPHLTYMVLGTPPRTQGRVEQQQTPLGLGVEVAGEATAFSKGPLYPYCSAPSPQGGRRKKQPWHSVPAGTPTTLPNLQMESQESSLQSRGWAWASGSHYQACPEKTSPPRCG